MKRLALAISLLFAAQQPAPAQRARGSGVEDDITARGIRAHLEFLASDRLEGRAPASRGGQLAALYIASQFERAGLEPVHGSFFQPVRLLGTTILPERFALDFAAGAHHLRASYGDDVVVWTGAPDSLVRIDADLVFVGYGIHAPEYHWDDFKDADVAGKVLIVLAGDPPAPADDATLFDGAALTYYGRWTYKLEEAARRGAAGALIVHSTASAGYAWSAVQSSWSGERLVLADDDAPTIPLGGWITHGLAAALSDAASIPLDTLAARAATREFRPITTRIRLRARFAARIRRLETANVVGLVPGRGAGSGDVVIYTAHYDHLGIGTPVDGDSIYNGAYDNASGVAALIEIGAAFARLDRPPRRSVLLIATAAEEAGLLGAEHYVRHPLFPLERTRASINIDGVNLWGETDDVATVGAERSTLGRIVEHHARQLGMRLTPDRSPGVGLFFRGDHFPFARAGVPAVSIHHGLDFRGRPAGWGVTLLQRYIARHYHQPSDHFDPAFDLAGAAQQARLAFRVGLDIANADTSPEWYPDAAPATPGHYRSPASQPRR